MSPIKTLSSTLTQGHFGNVGRKAKFMDWSVSLLDSTDIAKFHMTQYGNWRTRAKVLSYKDFEDEPLPAKSPLKKFNTLLAPHNSNSSPRAWQNVHESTLRQLMEVLQK